MSVFPEDLQLKQLEKGLVVMEQPDLIEEYITKRINQIIREINPKRVHEYYEVQEAILESLDQEHKKKFEALIDDLVAWGAEECKAVYVAAFFEGLRLGHKAF